jgi:hypothetical protein
MEKGEVASEGCRVGMVEGDLINVQCKPIQNHQNDSPPYKESILRKMGKQNI